MNRYEEMKSTGKDEKRKRNAINRNLGEIKKFFNASLKNT